jgi:hypothetical protein
MNGKSWFFVIASMLASNGWWYCATQQPSLGETPSILVPIIATIICVIMVAAAIYASWED